MGRGRPAMPKDDAPRRQYEQVFYEFDSPKVRDEGWKMVWTYDLDKNEGGPIKTEIIYPKGTKFPKPKIDKGKSYGGLPVVMVFKTSKRSNAKVKIKVWNNENIDYILSSPKLPGVPDNAVILEVGVGKSLVEKYKIQYGL
jgi:hypothetical protein